MSFFVPVVGLLVGSHGCVMTEDSPEFLVSVLADPTPDYDAPLFAVKNLGFVLFRRYAELLEITVRPETVAPRAVIAAIANIASSSARLFRIKHLKGDWQIELTVGAREASARLLQLCHRADVESCLSRH
jgi:hypothetical protein